MKLALVLLCIVGALLAGATSSSARPAFTARVDNPWFPLQQGSRYAYAGVKDGAPSRDVVVVARRTTTIDGKPCAVVEDRLYLRGHLRERTTDWYSQDARGNVWYMGEDTAELDVHGHVTSTEGTWKAGVDGAVAGIYMPARPRVGMSGRQEYYRGHAEDRFRVIGVFRSVVGGRSSTVVLTQETTRLEPGTVDHKMYVHGVGTVLEQTEHGGDERNELVSLTTSS
jgi:hypothetical protein